MADEFAELPTETPAVPAEPPKAAEPVVSPVTAEAETVLAKLDSMGINPENAAAIVQKAQATDRMAYLVENNPRAIFEELEKTSPELFKRALDEATNLYLERNPQPDGQTGAKSSVADSPVIKALENRIASFESKLSAENVQKQFQERLKSYESRREEYIAKLPQDTPEFDKEYLRMKTDRLISLDPKAVSSISQGNYIELAKQFQRATELLAADKKTTQAQQEQARAAQRGNSHPEFAPGPELTVKPEDIDSKDIWGDAGLARDVQKVSARKR
jgi:hypothetical protein